MNYLTEIRDTLSQDEELSQWLPVQDNQSKMVFVGNIPTKYIERRDVTTILITGLSNAFIEFGGNNATAREQEIEIKIWYAPSTDFESFEWSTNKALEAIGFRAFSYDGPTVDEETKQYKTVVQFRRTKFKGEK